MKRGHALVGTIIGIALALGGCTKSSSDTASDSSGGSDSSASSSGGGGAQSGIERQASQAAMAEIQKHWVKVADGWITARNEGSDFAPVLFLRQIHDISIDSVDAADLSDSDRMNGFEWAGKVSFKRSPCREAGDAGIVLSGTANIMVDRVKGRWSQWIDYTPETMDVQKVKGQWQIRQDTWFLRGKIPTATDYANAGVRQ